MCDQGERNAVFHTDAPPEKYTVSNDSGFYTVDRFQVGHTYKVRGGWDAVVIWKRPGMFNLTTYYAIHRPGSEEESVPISHGADGAALTTFSVNMPPAYGGHPADLTDREF